MARVDDLDVKLLHSLSEDSSLSVPALAEKMNVNASVLYSRIKRMNAGGVIRKFTIDIDETMLGFTVRATIGVKRDPKSKEQVHKALLAVPGISNISEVTGRFDILASMRAKSLDELHTVTTEKIGKIPGIQSTETLVELQKKSKTPSYALK